MFVVTGHKSSLLIDHSSLGLYRHFIKARIIMSSRAKLKKRKEELKDFSAKQRGIDEATSIGGTGVSSKQVMMLVA